MNNDAAVLNREEQQLAQALAAFDRGARVLEDAYRELWAARETERADRSLLCPVERWFVPLARTVAEVHRAGLVHADLKPANVLFRAPGEPVISDFGIASAPGQPALGGSFGYLAPERLLGEPLTPADDVFALGRILQDALDAVARGREPGQGAGEPSPRLAAVVRAALADRSDRPPDASALCSLLE